MEWGTLLLLFLSSLIVLLAIKVPVAFALLGVTVLASLYFYGLLPGLNLAVLGMYDGLTTFTLLPIPLFLLMGDLLFRSGVAPSALRALANMFGRMPGRLGLLTTVSGAVFGVLSGSAIATTALLGRTFIRDMRESGYSEGLSMGSVLASGGLAMIVPPSTIVIVWGATARVSIGPLLIAGIIPGLLMALGYALVILGWAGPLHGAPRADEVPHVSVRDRLLGFATHVLPLSLIVFLVLGLIFLGVATPTESAALGVVGALALAIAYRQFTWRLLYDCAVASARVAGMIFLILAASGGYSQLMSFSGATLGVVEFMTSLDIPPLLLLLLIQLTILFLGVFLEQIAIILVTIPLLMPVVNAMGWDPLWFGILMLINLQVALTTPPFGMGLFVMKGIVPFETRLTSIYRAAFPFVLSDLAVIGLLVAFPFLVTWLPSYVG